MIRAIQTKYAGCHFRSRLEARWAVFFDQLGIEWRYELEGFETPAGRYLPDFYLPAYRRWIEIKGGSFTKRDQDRASYFAESRWQLSEGYRLLQGDVPRKVQVGPWDLPTLRVQMWAQLVIPVIKTDGELVGDKYIKFQPGTGKPIVSVKPGELLDYPAGTRGLTLSLWVLGFDPAEVNKALTSARSARFEFGQSGGTL